MGTFHEDKGELHGITVVVDLKDSRLFVGRCDTVTPESVILFEAAQHDEHEPGPDGRQVTKQAYIARAARIGFWKKHDRVIVPLEDVASIRPLADLTNSGEGPRS